ncbi:olfactory receptor 13A1-like [Choloepus didactylus]|uniref:olfactory receptor 13A1-like n=1 Tax=Choloepus didactylus TaxID=27675 RepID=UPI00189D5119|nr:olfactory receptor 13A1-like [Choloepus didactylus]
MSPLQTNAKVPGKEPNTDDHMELSPGVTPGCIGKSNQTQVTEFILQGFSEHPELQLPLFGCFFFLYTMALMGNTLIITVITCSCGLHSPMYFFLLNLATMDIICSSTVLPKVLAGLAWEENTISFQGCMTQLFFLVWSASSELLLLTVMAYDRYVAICRPLHYGTLMSLRLCLALAMGVWASCALNSSINIALMAQLSFCGPNVITHFFCEIPPLLLLSCSPTHVNSIMTTLADAFYGGINFLLTLVSYGYIIASILRIHSAEGKQKAFSTCSSHLIVVSIYYSAVFCAYISPASSYSPERSKLAGVLYTAISPTINPLIYTLRNQEFKAALGKLFPFCRH